MASAEEKIQQTVDSLHSGKLAQWIWRGIFAAVAIGLSVYYLVHEFCGLPVLQAMDQAQIGREILRGHGWQTKIIRPLAIGQLREHGRDITTAIWQDTYNAPIPPLLDAGAIFIPIHAGWNLTSTDFVYSGDRAIAIMGVIFFLGSVLVLYFIALEIFDQRLASMACGLVLICDMMWRYSLSGLPQMFLLLLFHLNVYVLLRAMRARYSNQPNLGWIAAAGLGFGLMALTHALSIFLFVPVLLFSFFFFQPRGRAAFVLLIVFLAVYAPWLVRNAMVCGDFRGIAGLSGLDGIVHSESGHTRRFSLELGGVTVNSFARNFWTGLNVQFNRIFEYMGWSCVAPIAFVSVLHGFRRPVRATFRWLLLAMWGSAACGMAIFGMKEERLFAANQFHLLFVPLFICYGLAFVLVQCERQSGARNLSRRAVLIVIFIISGIPLLGRMIFQQNSSKCEWPPYLPPSIAMLRDWFKPDEIIASDMPWAVAWYADRRSLWMPVEQKYILDRDYYADLGAPVSALFFTPISGTQNTVGDLSTGEYKFWNHYILRNVDLAQSPFPYKAIMGTPDCVLYMDTDRRKPQGH
jgi:hypothetical protein